MKKIGTALLLLGFCSTAHAQHVFKTKSVLMEIASSARIIKLVDLRRGKNYVPEGQAGYLVRVKAEGKELAPTALVVKKGVLSLTFPGGIGLGVRVAEKPEYLRFELVEAGPPEKIEAVLWGPIQTTIGETIGEVVGVVRDKDFAIGIQALNTKTCGGKLVNDEGTTGGRTTATKEEFGSGLQAFCVNQARDRMITVWNLYKDVPVKALPGFRLEGSALVVFGTGPADVLPLIGRVEVAEGLPHPVLDGQWVRASGAAGRPYLIAAFSEKTINAMLEYTRRLGFPALYHSGPFKTWGHFDLLEDLFPNGRAGFKACVDKGRAMGLRVGAHTLTNFITTNDPFVTTAANKGLMAAGTAVLQKDIDPSTAEIAVDRDDYFKQSSNLNSVLIGSEIVRFRAVSGAGPYTLTDCIRGAFGTASASHTKGAEVRMLMDHPYKTFFPDWPMQEELIRNLAGFFNETGTAQLDFDGHEGTCYLGRGDFGHVHFVETFLGRVGHLVVNGSSNIGHYYWHFNSYINWGEPWYASFRESQSRYRFDNQPFLERNYMPNMLGWFLMTPATTVEDIEWMEARAAGYGAGYAFVAEYETLTGNPDTDRIIEAVRTWEEAKDLKVFDEEQRARLKDPDRDFHLEKTGAGRWTLQSHDKFLFEHRKKARQPGEPTASEWTFENAREPQPVRLQLLVTGEEAAVEDVALEVDRFFRVTVPRALKKGQSLVWDGSEQALVYGDKGQLIERVPLGKGLPPLQKGKHVIAVDAKFTGGAETVIKGTVRLKGGVEEIAQ